MPTILFAEGVCVLLFSGIVLFVKNKQSTHRIMVFVGLTMAYVLTYAWAAETGFLLRVPFLICSDTAAICVLAALVYMAFFPMLHEGRRRLLHIPRRSSGRRVRHPGLQRRNRSRSGGKIPISARALLHADT